jgi:uncharacterized membrane protein
MTTPGPSAAPEPADTLRCPACGGANAADAVFCANHSCHKALGDFRYSEEEAKARSNVIEKLADSVNAFVGRPHFITVHVLWFLAWVLVNSGLFMGARVFDAYPFGLLGIVLAIEAILITGFVLIAGQRQSRRAELRAELDYEVNVRSFRKFEEVERRLERLTAALEDRETAGARGARGPAA